MWSIFWTVLSGVLVFVLGQILLKVVIEPIQELRKLKGEIVSIISYYSNMHGPILVYDEWKNIDPEDLKKHHSLLMSRKTEGSNNFRSCAGRLYGIYNNIGLKSYLYKWEVVPNGTQIQEAYDGLISLSNSVRSTDDPDAEKRANFYEKQVIDNLGIKFR